MSSLFPRRFSFMAHAGMSLLLLGMSLGLVLLTSCSKTDNTLMESIPEGATFVAVVNLDKVINNAGCGISSSGITLTPQIQSRINATIGKHMYESMVKAVPYIDSKHVMCFAEKTEFILTYMIKEPDGYAKAMEEVTGKPETHDGFTVYAGRLVTVVKDNQAWTMEGDLAHVVSEITDVLDKASEKNFTSRHGLVEFIEESEAAGVVMNLAAMGLKNTDTWIAAHLKLGNMSAKADVQLMLSDGEIVPADGFCNIDRDFLRYVPGDFNYAIAIGVENGETLAGWLRMAMPMMPFEQRGMLESVLPFIAKVKGTIAVAGLSDGSSDDELGHISPLLVMAHMDQADVDVSVQSLVTLARGMGASVSSGKDGYYVASAPGMKIYIGNIDGNLGISTVPFESTRENSMAPAFESRFGGAYFMLPRGYKGMFDRPVKVDANLQPQFMQLEMTFPDTKGPFLKTYLESAVNE